MEKCCSIEKLSTKRVSTIKLSGHKKRLRNQAAWAQKEFALCAIKLSGHKHKLYDQAF